MWAFTVKLESRDWPLFVIRKSLGLCATSPNDLPAPRAPDLPRNLFEGTSRYYAQYRVPYPRVLLDDLRSRAHISGDGRLFDIGCGPGRLTLPLAKYFREVWGVDQEPEMID